MSSPSREYLGPDGLAGIVNVPDDLRTFSPKLERLLPSVSHFGSAPRLAVAHAGGSLHRRDGVVCAFVGRLANRESLAIRHGCSRRAPSATVAAAAVSDLCDEAIAHFRGEFALVVWDEWRKHGIVARDHLGGRTVFLASSGNRLMFASDIRLLIELMPRRPGVDDAGLMEWLIIGGTTGGRTLHEGISRLPPGAMVVVDGQRWREARYWQPRYRAPLKVSRNDAAAELHAAIRRSVASRLEGQETVGVLLSGGLDSSTVASTAHDVLAERGKTVSAYSLTFPGHPEVDETELIESVATHLRIPRIEMQVNGGSMLLGGLEFLRTWGALSPSPNTSFTAKLQYRAAQDGMTLLLDGEGGDELFGANPFLPAHHFRHGRVRAAWRICTQVPGFGPDPPRWQVRRAFRVLAFRGAMPYWAQRAAQIWRRDAFPVPEWFAETSSDAFARSFDPLAWKRRRGPLWWTNLASTLTESREMLGVHDYLRQLGALSGMTRAHPLLDLDLVQLVLSLPPEYAYDARFSRALVRESMHGRLPASVVLRTGKSAFLPLVRHSLFASDLPLVRRLLEDPQAEIRRFIKPSALRDLLAAAGSGDVPDMFPISAWRLANAECWLRYQEDPAFVNVLLDSSDLEPLSVRFLAGGAHPAHVGSAVA
jgi:asparagine synthase (glutamine-hydrolysing)